MTYNVKNVFNVKDFGAQGDNSTDDTVAIQRALNTCIANGGVVEFPTATYKTTSGLTIGSHDMVINGNNSVINFVGTDGYAIDAALISTVYPQFLVLNDLSILLNGNGATTGIRWRFTHSHASNVYVYLQHNNQTGWDLHGDLNGTGPYYNNFYDCGTQGTSNLGQTGFLFSYDNSTPSRCPNANQFWGGRVGQVGTAYSINGDRNAFYTQTVEGIVANGFGFKINHPTVSGGVVDCAVYSAYVEQSGEVGTTVFYIGPNSIGAAIGHSFLTGVAPGINYNDLGTGTVIIADGYTLFNTNGMILKQDNPGHVTQIKGITPALSLYETGNNYSVTMDNEGGSDAGNFAFTIRDNIPRLLAAFGAGTAQLAASQLLLANASVDIGIYVGSSQPNGLITANVGSIYLANSGGAGTTLWTKETGTGNTGWSAVISADTVPSGDLSGTYATPTVAKIHGNAIAAQSLGSTQDGYVLTWDNTDGYWKGQHITSGSVSLSGDVTGAATSNTVTALQHNSVAIQTLGVNQDGYVLTWDNADSYWAARQSVPINVKNFGVKGDAQTSIQGSMISGTKNLTCDAFGVFVPSDVGKFVLIAGAGASANALASSIATFVTSSHVILVDTATTSTSGASMTWGTNDTAAIQAAINQITTSSRDLGLGRTGSAGTLFFPSGGYILTAEITIPGALTISGDGFPPGGIQASAPAASTIFLKSHAGNAFHFTGVNGTGAAQGGGLEKIRIVQNFGKTGGGPTGIAILIDCPDVDHRPGWLRFEHLNVEEAGGLGGWAKMVKIDGTNALAISGGITDILFYDCWPHNTYGFIELIQCGGIKFLQCKASINADVTVTGIVAQTCNGITFIDTDIGNLTMDYTFDTVFMNGILGNGGATVTFGAHVQGNNIFIPSRIPAGTTFVDNTTGTVGLMYFDSTPLTSQGGSWRTNKTFLLANSQYAYTLNAAGSGGYAVWGMDASNTFRLDPGGLLQTGIGNNPAPTAAIGFPAVTGGDLVMTFGNYLRWSANSNAGSKRWLGIDTSDRMLLGPDATAVIVQSLSGDGYGYVAVDNTGLLSVSSKIRATIINKTTNYTILSSDYVISVGTLSTPIALTLPSTPTAGDTFIIKDANGSAATHNITINGNGHNIDGSTTFVLSTNYENITVIYNSSTWMVV